jgi:hypothetical protein
MNSYTKLKSGDWGVRCEGEVKPGQSVTVTKKDGSVKTEIIDAVLWSGDGKSLCSIKRRAAKKNYPGQMCPGCGSEPLDNNLSCWECGYSGE